MNHQFVIHNGLCRIERAAKIKADVPERTAGLNVDFYDNSHRRRPLTKARFCIAKFEWRGGAWRRVKRLTGPRQMEDLIDDLMLLSKGLGVKTTMEF